jgi:hypothetical protein
MIVAVLEAFERVYNKTGEKSGLLLGLADHDGQVAVPVSVVVSFEEFERIVNDEAETVMGGQVIRDEHILEPVQYGPPL